MLWRWSLYGALPLICLAVNRPAEGVLPLLPQQIQPIVITPNNDARYLIEDVFVGSSCFGVTDMSVTGMPAQVGTFAQGGATVGIESGIILSTGNIDDAIGPNTSPSTTTAHGNLFNDPDLVALSGGPGIYDPVSIEFEFTPSVSEISFTYVFASEEYCEFAGSPFNDVFGFFLSGPGINGPYANNAENIAVVPGSSTYVGINTINHFTNPQYYRNNIPEGAPFSCTDDPALFPDFLEYDGLTTLLTATASVIPCETYRIKIILADKAEDLYDSTVFLGMSSFEAGTGASVTAGITGNGPDSTTAYEGCGNGFFRFERQVNDTGRPLLVHFSLHPGSTAIPGLDFAPLPASITIPQGESSFVLPVSIFTDALPEGIETIRIELLNPCSCQPEFAEIRISDPPPIAIFLTDTIVCAGLPVSVLPIVTGGVEPLAFSWSTGSTALELTLAPQSGGTYTLTASDACGQTAQAAVQIQTFTPSAVIAGAGYVCNGREEAELLVNYSGPPGTWDFIYTHNGNPFAVNGNTGPQRILQVNQPGSYQLFSVNTGACRGTVSGVGIIDEVNITIETEITPPSCAGAADADIQATASGGQAPYSYAWNVTTVTTAALPGLRAGDYTLTVTDAGGCMAETEATISDPPPLTAEVVANHPPCPGNLGQIEIWHTGGGEFPLRYSIDGGRNFQFLPDFDSIAPGSWQVLIEDAKGCRFNQTVEIIAPPELQIALDSLITLRMGESYRLKAIPSIAPDAIDSIIWTPSAGLSCADCLEPELTALRSTSYHLRIVSSQGCSAGASIAIGVDLNIPVFVPNAFSPLLSDGINDRFTVFARPEVVSQIKLLRIFDRWGGIVFERLNFPPNNEREGWDGSFRGRPLSPGVFTWWTELELIDGSTLQLQGDVTIVR